MFSNIRTLSAKLLLGIAPPVRRARFMARGRSGDALRKPYRSTDDDVTIVANRWQRAFGVRGLAERVQTARIDRPIDYGDATPDRKRFLRQVYAGTRSRELAMGGTEIWVQTVQGVQRVLRFLGS